MFYGRRLQHVPLFRHVHLAVCNVAFSSLLGLMAVAYSDSLALQQMAVVFWLRIIASVFVILSAPTQAGRLYTENDPVTILTSDTLKQTVRNSTTAWLVQFYSSWCGHCIQYSPTWKALAGDVKGRLFSFLAGPQ